LSLAVTAALVSAGVLGLWFSSTRGIAIMAIAALSFMFPVLAVLILVGSALSFFVFRSRH